MDNTRKNLTQKEIDVLFNVVNKIRRRKNRELTEEEADKLVCKVVQMEFDAKIFAQEINYALSQYYKEIDFKVYGKKLTCTTRIGDKFIVTVKKVK